MIKNNKGFTDAGFTLLMILSIVAPVVGGQMGLSLDRDDYNVTRDTVADPAMPEYEYCEANPIKC